MRGSLCKISVHVMCSSSGIEKGKVCTVKSYCPRRIDSKFLSVYIHPIFSTLEDVLNVLPRLAREPLLTLLPVLVGELPELLARYRTL